MYKFFYNNSKKKKKLAKFISVNVYREIHKNVKEDTPIKTKTESKPSKEKYNKKSKEYPAESNGSNKNENKGGSKKYKREVPAEDTPPLAADKEPQLDNTEETLNTTVEKPKDKKFVNKSAKKSKENVEAKKTERKPQKNIPVEAECSNSEPKQHVQGKECWKENADNIAYAEDAEIAEPEVEIAA